MCEATLVIAPWWHLPELSSIDTKRSAESVRLQLNMNNM